MTGIAIITKTTKRRASRPTAAPAPVTELVSSLHGHLDEIARANVHGDFLPGG